MKNKKIKLPKIIKRLFKAKELFHQQQAKMPFEKKIKVLVSLQKLAQDIPVLTKEKQMVWQIY